MRGLGIFLLTILVATPVLAQVDLDDSFPADAGVTFERLHAAIGDKVADPKSIQYKRMIHNDRMICGLLNSRNASGGYDEFGPFIYVISDGSVLVTSPAQLEGFRPTLTKLFDRAGCSLSSLGLAGTSP